MTRDGYTYVALLRAINVGGRSVAMSVVRDTFAAVGCRDVRTYIQSGNVVFVNDARSEGSLTLALQEALLSATGLAVPVVLRSASELQSVVVCNPFTAAEQRRLHVAFFAEPPDPTAFDDAVDGAVGVRPSEPGDGSERLAINGREVYLWLPDGVGRSPMLRALHRPLRAATVRNWQTVNRLVAMSS